MPLFLEKGEKKLAAQIRNLANKVGQYADKLGISAEELSTIQKDAAAFDFMVSNQQAVQTFARTFTSYKKMLRNGEGQVLGPAPIPPVLENMPPMPSSPNMEIRMRKMLQRMVHHPSYTQSIGADLGIEAPQSNFVPRTGKPKFSIKLSSGYPKLHWKKGKFQGVEIWKDSGQGFVKLDRDMHPDYIDKSALPKTGESATWRYRMIYLLNDETVGNWSDIATVTLHGED